MDREHLSLEEEIQRIREFARAKRRQKALTST
jgi:hypothetical protein